MTRPRVPQPADWPDPPPRSAAGDALTDVVIATFRLNARLHEHAQGLASVGGLTSSWWQVLGGIVDAPRTVAEIGRRMGMTRQGVQRVADLLVDRGLAEYRPNPAHQRAKLLTCTEAGQWAIRQIAVAQHPWADRVAHALGEHDLRGMLATMRRLIEVLEDN